MNNITPHDIEATMKVVKELATNHNYRLVQPEVPKIGFMEPVQLKPEYPILMVGSLNLHVELCRVYTVLECLLKESKALQEVRTNLEAIEKHLPLLKK